MIQTITVMGRIGQNAVTKQVGDKKVVTFSVACSNRIKQADVTTWYSCELWRSEALAQYLTKGTIVTVTGEFRLGYYTNIHEELKVDPRIIVSQIGLGGSRQEASAPASTPAPQIPASSPAPDHDDWQIDNDPRF